MKIMGFLMLLAESESAYTKYNRVQSISVSIYRTKEIQQEINQRSPIKLELFLP